MSSNRSLSITSSSRRGHSSPYRQLGQNAYSAASGGAPRIGLARNPCRHAGDERNIKVVLRAVQGREADHYPVLYIVDALHPERARLVVLPNPRSAQGLAFYAEQGAGVRLQFAMPVH